jgi:murein L,D-transpeptidase YcbB/YkuD
MTRTTRSLFAAALALAAAACSSPDKPAKQPEARARVETVLSRADSTSIISLVAGDTLHLSKATVDFYRSRRWRLAWANEDNLTSQGEKMAQLLGKAEQDGLSPLRYRYDVLNKMVTSMKSSENLDDDAQAQYAADVDILLTEAFARYATDLARGTLNPDSAGLKWRIPRGNVPKGNLLRVLAKGTDPEAVLARIRPIAPQYPRLMKLLASLQEAKQKGGWVTVPEGDVKRGASDSVVITALRSRLSASEDPREATLAQRGAATPAVYDQDLFLALKHFQERNGIDGDGALGPKTLEELNHPIDERIAEVRLNMDRWRWLPHDLGKMYVMVNVAGFEMSVIENNRVIEEMNVVVGQEGWETPIFADTMEHLVVNPYWNVPASILGEEMGNLANDPDYLARNNFERTSDGGLRQRPGPKNALGQFKFMFPNKDNIYLHDTPADQLFSRASRAFSHGCIRLERPRDLAYLLGEKLAGQSPRQIDALVATGNERWIKFRKKIPIYILYFTTWVDEDGTIRYHHDVYGHDKAIEGQVDKLDARVM